MLVSFIRILDVIYLCMQDATRDWPIPCTLKSRLQSSVEFVLSCLPHFELCGRGQSSVEIHESVFYFLFFVNLHAFYSNQTVFQSL